MNTITCPACGQQAKAFGSVTSCWCDKMYCDHLNGMFANYSCACGSSGETPDAKQHREHQHSKFAEEMADEISKLLSTLPAKIKGTFPTQSVIATYSDVQVVFANGRSAVVTVTGFYKTPQQFQVASNGQVYPVSGGEALKLALANIANS